MDQLSSAHPGNTASDGAHYCWTNCDYWGYEYGTRHSHGGYYEEPDYEYDYEPSYTPNYTYNEAMDAQTKGKDHAENVNREYIIANAKSLASSDASIIDTVSQSASRARALCEEAIEYENTPSDTYRSNFQSSYTSACIPVYTAAYDEAFNEAIKKAKEVADALASSQSSSSQNTAFLLIFGLVCLIGLCYGVYLAFW